MPTSPSFTKPFPGDGPVAMNTSNIAAAPTQGPRDKVAISPTMSKTSPRRHAV